MKVLYVTPYSPKQISGVANVVLSLMRGIRIEGHDSTYLTFEHDGRAPEDIDLVEIPFEGPRFIRSLKAKRYLGKWLDKHIEGYDLIHAHSPVWMANEVIKAGKKNGIPSCITLHGKYPLTTSAYDKAFMNIAKKTISTVDKVFAVSRESILFWDVTGCSVVHNGIDTSRFSKDKDARERFRERYDLQEKYLFLFVGRISENKGVADLLRASDELAKEHPDMRLVLVGPVEEGNGSDMMDRISARGYVRHFEPILDIAPFYQASDCFVSPSHFEGLPLTTLEAMSCELPVIVSNVGEHPDVIDHGKNGFLVEPHDPAGLRDRMEVCMSRSYPDIGRNARNTVEERFSEKGMVERYMSEYAGLVGG